MEPDGISRLFLGMFLCTLLDVNEEVGDPGS